MEPQALLNGQEGDHLGNVLRRRDLTQGEAEEHRIVGGYRLCKGEQPALPEPEDYARPKVVRLPRNVKSPLLSVRRRPRA